MYKVYKTKVGEKSKPCKGGAYNTAERGWFADAVRRVVVKPGKYLRRGLHKANEQITFAKLELGWSWSSLSLSYTDPVGSFSVMASWYRGVSVPHMLTPCVVYACTGGGSHAWEPLMLLALLSSTVQWLSAMAIRYCSKAELKICVDFLCDPCCFLKAVLTFLERFCETLRLCVVKSECWFLLLGGYGSLCKTPNLLIGV